MQENFCFSYNGLTKIVMLQGDILIFGLQNGLERKKVIHALYDGLERKKYQYFISWSWGSFLYVIWTSVCRWIVTLGCKLLSNWLAKSVNNSKMLLSVCDVWPAYTIGMEFYFFSNNISMLQIIYITLGSKCQKYNLQFSLTTWHVEDVSFWVATDLYWKGS